MYVYLSIARWAISLHSGWYYYLLITEYLLSYFYKLIHSKCSITSFGHTFFSQPTNVSAGKLFDKRWVRCSTRYLPPLSTSVFPYCYTAGECPANQLIAVNTFCNHFYHLFMPLKNNHALVKHGGSTYTEKKSVTLCHNRTQEVLRVLVWGSVHLDKLHKKLPVQALGK